MGRNLDGPLGRLPLGRPLDGFWEPGVLPWNLAAGCLLITEASGAVTGLLGQPFTAYDGYVAASNGALHAFLLAALGEARHALWFSPRP